MEFLCNLKTPPNHKRKKEKKGTKKKYKINWKTRFKNDNNSYISIITLSVNRLKDIRVAVE